MSQSRALSVIADNADSAMRFIETVSKSLKIGEGTPPERESAAMICATQMIAEQLTFAELRRKYHIYPDKLDYRAEYIHATLEEHGWEWDWEKDGEDGKEAVFVAKRNGKARKASFSIDLAKRKGLVKPGSNWTKDPAQQLRARAITRFATMWEPSIGAGMEYDTDMIDRTEIVEVEEDGEGECGQLVSSETVEPEKQITLSTEIKDLPFNRNMIRLLNTDEPRILTVGDLIQYTEEELQSRRGFGDFRVQLIQETLNKSGFSLAEGRDAGSDDERNESESSQSEDPQEEAVSEAPSSEQQSSEEIEHGKVLAEVQQICNYDHAMKKLAMQEIPKLWPDKSSLYDLDSLQLHILLMRIMSEQTGLADRFNAALDAVMKDPHSLDRVKRNISSLRDRLKN